MDRSSFEAALTQDGYAIRLASMPPHEARPMHTHPFDVRLLVLDGVFMLDTEAGRQVFPAGAACSLAAGIVHSEVTGAEGAQYVLGTRPTMTTGLAADRSPG